MTPTVVVLDGEHRAALAVVRSLGRRGCRVHVGSSVRHSLAGGSRYAASESLLPDPLAGSDEYASAVARLAKDHGAEVLLPVTEASSLALLERRDRLPGVLIPTSELDHFRRACNKAAVLSLAKDLGIAVPGQWTVSGEPGRLPEIPQERFPVVVKPTRSVVGPEGKRRKVGVRYARTADHLVQVLQELGPEAGPFLIQARIEGPGIGVFLLRWGGEVIATFAHRRIREKPPSGGVSVCCESVVLPAPLLAQSAALLAALDWSGVAMIEYKRDARSEESYLMEVNPRFWGSLQLAIDAGVDFPWYLVQAVLGQQVAPVSQWQVGVRSRWCWGDIDHLITRLRHSRGELDLPDGTPGVLRTALSVLVPWRPGQRSDVFRFTDPVPAVRETVAWVRAL